MKEAGLHALLAIYSRLEGGYAIDVITQQKGSIVQSKLFAISQVLLLAEKIKLNFGVQEIFQFF